MLCSVATLIHDTYLPVYLSEVLHLSNSKIGNLQAIAQFLSKASGSVSGTAADLLTPARMVIFGTLLTTINKPMFAASGLVFGSFGAMACLYWITFGKIFDRVSKGIREAPSKALIGELAAASGDSPAAAFSLRQSMATFGALVGAASAATAYKLSGQNYIATFALAAVPATLALGLVSAGGGRRGRPGGRWAGSAGPAAPRPPPPPPAGARARTRRPTRSGSPSWERPAPCSPPSSPPTGRRWPSSPCSTLPDSTPRS